LRSLLQEAAIENVSVKHYRIITALANSIDLYWMFAVCYIVLASTSTVAAAAAICVTG